MVQGLFLITEMTFIMLNNFISEKSSIGGQDVVHNFKLKNGESNISLVTLKGINTINSADCLLVEICLQQVLLSAVGGSNFWLIRNLEADLQESLLKVPL